MTVALLTLSLPRQLAAAGVTVAILDTGVDSTHPDLSSKIVAGWNFFDNNSNTADVYGHGTKVAGGISPRLGCCQRTSASKPRISPLIWACG